MKFPPCLSHLSTPNLSVSLHVDLSLYCDSPTLSNVPLFWDSWFFVFFLPSSACHKMCQNGGTLNESTCTCDCANGFGGDDCESECIAHWVLVMLLSRMEVAYVSLLCSFNISTASMFIMGFLLERLLHFNSGWQIGWLNISTKHKLRWQWACGGDSVGEKEPCQSIRDGIFFHLLEPSPKHLHCSLHLTIKSRMIWGSLHVMNPILCNNFKILTSKAWSIARDHRVR